MFSDAALALELATNLAAQRFLVGFHGQQHAIEIQPAQQFFKNDAERTGIDADQSDKAMVSVLGLDRGAPQGLTVTHHVEQVGKVASEAMRLTDQTQSSQGCQGLRG